MRKLELLTIYEYIRKAEFRRRELQRVIIQEREKATALRSCVAVDKVKGGIRKAPQEKYIDRVGDYDEQLKRTVRCADAAAKRYFYDVQRLVTWNHAKAIYGFITGLAPYCGEYAGAVREMAQALTDGEKRAAEWDTKAKTFSPSSLRCEPKVAPLTQEQIAAIQKRVLWQARGKPLPVIVKAIRRKCKRRRYTENGSREDEALYAQICALERVYIYSRQRFLTEKELVSIELYMTDELTPREMRESKGAIIAALRKIAAARSTQNAF